MLKSRKTAGAKMEAKKLKELLEIFLSLERREGEVVVQNSVFERAASALGEYLDILQKGESEARVNRGNTRWSAEEDERLVAEWKSGLKLKQLCEKHRRSAGGIVSRLAALGVLEEDETNAKTRWSAEEDEALKSEFERGFSIEVMAKRHGRSLGGIIGRLAKLGLSDEERFI